MTQWRISRRRGICSACERPFEDGERHVSTLRVTPEGLERNEVCEAWWERDTERSASDACRAACLAREEPLAGGANDASAEPLFWWFTRHSAERRKTVQLDLESLERLFLELEGREEEALRELRYVLCLLLLRKRRVKVENVLRDEDGESFVVRRPRREARYRVHVFDFGPDRVAELRSQLQALFDGEELGEGLALAGAQAPEPAGEAPEGADAAGDSPAD